MQDGGRRKKGKGLMMIMKIRRIKKIKRTASNRRFCLVNGVRVAGFYVHFVHEDGGSLLIAFAHAILSRGNNALFSFCVLQRTKGNCWLKHRLMLFFIYIYFYIYSPFASAKGNHCNDTEG